MRYRFFILLLCLPTVFVQAQTLGQAKTWFLQGQYAKALPVFKSSLHSKPKDASLSYWYGVCLTETGKTRQALPYLEFASQRKIVQASMYQAKVYLSLGALDTSLIYLEYYLSNSSIPEEKRIEAAKLKDSLLTSLELLQRVEDVLFIDSIIVPKQNMYTVLNLSAESGGLLPTMTIFPRMSLNYGYAYFPERNDRVYYADSLPGKGLELVARHRILDSWDDPELFPDNINRTGNEFNPYFLQDGVTLYFASDSEMSMGGSDIFVTRMNPATRTYLLPDRLNMPYNSPANDYFLIIDEFTNRGYLATDRNAKKGYVTIYTFMPSTEKTILKDKSLKELQAFAQIRCIRDTWKGKDIDSLLQNRPVTADEHTEISEQTNVFQFYINDSISYDSANDFQSDEARRTYQTYFNKLKQLSENKSKLEEKRQLYQTTAPASKDRLGVEILSLEQENQSLQKQLPSLEVSARNLEIRALAK